MRDETERQTANRIGRRLAGSNGDDDDRFCRTASTYRSGLLMVAVARMYLFHCIKRPLASTGRNAPWGQLGTSQRSASGIDECRFRILEPTTTPTTERPFPSLSSLYLSSAPVMGCSAGGMAAVLRTEVLTSSIHCVRSLSMRSNREWQQVSICSV